MFIANHLVNKVNKWHFHIFYSILVFLILQFCNLFLLYEIILKVDYEIFEAMPLCDGGGRSKYFIQCDGHIIGHL